MPASRQIQEPPSENLKVDFRLKVTAAVTGRGAAEHSSSGVSVRKRPGVRCPVATTPPHHQHQRQHRQRGLQRARRLRSPVSAMSGQARSASPSSADGRPLLSQSAATTHVRTSAEDSLDRPFDPASDVPNVESAPVVKPLSRSLAPSDVVEPLHSLSLQDDQLSQSGWPAMPAPLPTQSSEATEAVLQEESLVQSPRKPAPDQHTSNPKDLVPEAGEDSLLLRPAYEPSPSPSPGLEGRASPQVNRLEEDSPYPAPPPIEKESPLIWDHEPSVEKEQRSTRIDEADRGEFPDHKEQPSAVRERHASANDHVLVENGLPPIPLESSGLPHDVSQKARQGCAPNHRRPVANPPPAHLEHVHSDTRAPEVPFDFNKFLEQMKLRSAVPVGEYVRRYVRRLVYDAKC